MFSRALFVIIFARLPKRNVEVVSAALNVLGEHVMTMHVCVRECAWHGSAATAGRRAAHGASGGRRDVAMAQEHGVWLVAAPRARSYRPTFVLPPSDSESTRVSLELRNGTCWPFFFLSVRALMTFPRADRVLLMAWRRTSCVSRRRIFRGSRALNVSAVRASLCHN